MTRWDLAISKKGLYVQVAVRPLLIIKKYPASSRANFSTLPTYIMLFRWYELLSLCQYGYPWLHGPEPADATMGCPARCRPLDSHSQSAAQALIPVLKIGFSAFRSARTQK